MSDSEAIVGAITSVTKKWTKQKKAEERHARARLNRRCMWTSRNTLKDVAWEVMEQAYNKASANGRLPAHARQIYYAARPLVEEKTDKSLQDGYFTQTLLPEYIYEHSLAWNVVYDDRGHLVEPNHGGDDKPIGIGLGTLSVRKYLKGKGPPTLSTAETKLAELTSHGPSCRYGAVLFVEKEGFMPLFEEVKLAERYDVAIMSTKGMSNTASRELVERIGVPIYALHDFDKSGFSIVGTLRRSTKRYQFAGIPNVIDLGIRLKDIEKYDLAYEGYRPRGGGLAFTQNLRRNGATKQEIEILFNNRVELNAFASDDLVEWIEAKFAEHGVKKVVPGDDWLAKMYRSATATAHLEQHATEIIEEANKYGDDVAIPESLRNQVVERLKENPDTSWDRAVRAIANQDFDDDDDLGDAA